MRVTGIGFVGTRTTAGDEMGQFLRDVIGLRPLLGEPAGASYFEFPNGDEFAVAPVAADDPRQRTIGFIVDDLDTAVAELNAAGFETDDVAGDARWRYVHFTAPDGMLYELAERLRETS